MSVRARVACAALGLVGCGTVFGVTPIAAPPHALSPRPAASVEVREGAADRPHVDVARLTAHPRGDVGLQTLVRELRELAGQRGCDALVALTWDVATGTEAGVCVVYVDAP